MTVFEFEHLQVEVDKLESLITIKPLRVLSVDEINEFRGGFLIESGCRLILWDLRESDLTEITGDDAVRFSAGNTEGPAGTRLAFVVPTPADYGISRMISARMEIAGTKTTIGQFYDMDEAISWLKQPPGDLE